MRLKGKVALVTGAGSGLGSATAMRFAREGARVMCVDVTASAADLVARRIVEDGGEAFGRQGNITDEATCKQCVEATLERFGSLSTLVNSAGVRPRHAGPTPPTDDWRFVVDVNLTGSYLMSRAALPALQASGAGSITHMASIFGLVGGSTGAAYAASKGAIVNLTRQMAIEWAPRVRVNCVCPGVIETPMTAPLRQDPAWSAAVLKRYPLGRFGQPEEIAAAILYLASDEAAFVTGVALPVDGGYTAA